jgi:hypothetical protein
VVIPLFTLSSLGFLRDAQIRRAVDYPLAATLSTACRRSHGGNPLRGIGCAPALVVLGQITAVRGDGRSQATGGASTAPQTELLPVSSRGLQVALPLEASWPGCGRWGSGTTLTIAPAMRPNTSVTLDKHDVDAQKIRVDRALRVAHSSGPVICSLAGESSCTAATSMRRMLHDSIDVGERASWAD